MRHAYHDTYHDIVYRDRDANGINFFQSRRLTSTRMSFIAWFTEQKWIRAVQFVFRLSTRSLRAEMPRLSPRRDRISLIVLREASARAEISPNEHFSVYARTLTHLSGRFKHSCIYGSSK